MANVIPNCVFKYEKCIPRRLLSAFDYQLMVIKQSILLQHKRWNTLNDLKRSIFNKGSKENVNNYRIDYCRFYLECYNFT